MILFIYQGTRIQETRDTNTAQDVVSEYEDKTGRARDPPLLSPRNLAVCLPRLQLLQID